MFSKTADPTSAPATPPTRPATGNASRSILASDLRITGEVSSTGALEVMGEIDGNVTARSLTVGAEGRVAGTIRADQVEVKGRLDGKVASGDFVMRAAAQVTADVVYRTLVIESGAQIEGRFAKPKG